MTVSSSTEIPDRGKKGTVREYLESYFDLAKPRITILLLIVAMAAYLIASEGRFEWWGAMQAFLSVGLLSVGIFALNHYMERNQDQLMRRTRDRPLPSGRLKPYEALIFGLAFTVAGVGFSTFAVNLLTGIIAAAVAVSYLLIYTPLKYRTAFHTALGAFPGAAPPLAGWAVAQGSLDANAWILFGVLFLWQFPHFLSIEMIYKDDYAKAGIRVLPVVDSKGVHTAFQVIASLGALLVVSLLPLTTGLGTLWYAGGAGVLGVGFLVFGVRAVTTRKKIHARHLLRASVIYLPLIFLLLVFHP